MILLPLLIAALPIDIQKMPDCWRASAVYQLVSFKKSIEFAPGYIPLFECKSRRQLEHILKTINRHRLTCDIRMLADPISSNDEQAYDDLRKILPTDSLLPPSRGSITEGFPFDHLDKLGPAGSNGPKGKSGPGKRKEAAQ